MACRQIRSICLKWYRWHSLWVRVLIIGLLGMFLYQFFVDPMGPKIRVIHALDLGPPAHPYENIFLYERQLSNIQDHLSLMTVTSGIPREMNSAKRYKSNTKTFLLIIRSRAIPSFFILLHIF
ncbi:hypothetical protein K503DRAFT_90790 [Rhizopogon vinicolor AM-OR11-026]|uniref:Uncharacterized protein n=1 Tax=Rhizopogon vinicolor AM-OR11-026 TaxID=1314800 RepID=A0A1B7N3F8_9AGAM|nr:hypothetical protein K503DRAFT_90790 [Rhizopogon vinicolor AM-OR11-026]